MSCPDREILGERWPRTAVPVGPIGRLVDRVALERYMTKLIVVRNAHLKAAAEQQ